MKSLFLVLCVCVLISCNKPQQPLLTDLKDLPNGPQEIQRQVGDIKLKTTIGDDTAPQTTILKDEEFQMYEPSDVTRQREEMVRRQFVEELKKK